MDLLRFRTESTTRFSSPKFQSRAVLRPVEHEGGDRETCA